MDEPLEQTVFDRITAHLNAMVGAQPSVQRMHWLEVGREINEHLLPLAVVEDNFYHLGIISTMLKRLDSYRWAALPRELFPLFHATLNVLQDNKIGLLSLCYFDAAWRGQITFGLTEIDRPPSSDQLRELLQKRLG